MANPATELLVELRPMDPSMIRDPGGRQTRTTTTRATPEALVRSSNRGSQHFLERLQIDESFDDDDDDK